MRERSQRDEKGKRERGREEQQGHSLVRSAARLINTNDMQIKSIVRSFEF